jgi:hypothetical protein
MRTSRDDEVQHGKGSADFLTPPTGELWIWSRDFSSWRGLSTTADFSTPPHPPTSVHHTFKISRPKLQNCTLFQPVLIARWADLVHVIKYVLAICMVTVRVTHYVSSVIVISTTRNTIIKFQKWCSLCLSLVLPNALTALSFFTFLPFYCFPYIPPSALGKGMDGGDTSDQVKPTCYSSCAVAAPYFDLST